MKQAQVAKQLGVSEDTITFWENERTAPQIHFYPKLIQFLGYNPFVKEVETIGGQIYLYRTEQGLSHRQLAKIAKLDSATVGRWERNVNVPTVKERLRLIDIGILKK